jgi:N-acetylmuramoyl-L-alanine amidase
MQIIFYLISVSACIAGFYIVYFAVLKNIAAFRLNRAFLVAGIITSFVIPVIDVSFVKPDYHLHATDLLGHSSLNELEVEPTEITVPTKLTDFAILSAVYWIGFIICAFRLVFDVAGIITLKGRAKTLRKGQITIVESDIEQPFAFFNTIFLPRYPVETAIMEHEKAHVTKYHWMDLTIAEIAGLLLWFNPIMIFYKRSIKIQHEYEADASVLSNGTHVECYLDCLLKNLEIKNSTSIISAFFSRNIKQRILMMTRNNSTGNLKMLYLLFIPLACALLVAFSNKPLTPDAVLQPFAHGSADLVIVVDPGHGGDDTGSVANETSEKEIVLSISKNIKTAGESRGVKVILTRTGDQALSLEERVKIVDRHHAEMFVSIHLNNDPANASASGIDLVVSEKNQQIEKSNRMAEQLTKELSLLGTIKVNGIKNSNARVLSQNTSAAILVELGYLSNKSDHAYVSDANNQKAISEKIINAVLASVK